MSQSGEVRCAVSPKGFVMTRVTHVKKARKAIPAAGIKKGQEYFWWKFRFGSKHVSKTPPRRSQLTQSGKKAALFDAEDSVSDAIANVQAGTWGLSDLRQALEAAAESVREVAEEYRESASNMEDAFPNGSPKIDELNERADEVESTAAELDQVVNGMEEEDEEEIKKDAAAHLPKPPQGSCAKCRRRRLVEIKKNRGYGGGWHSEKTEPCPQCCRGLTVVVAAEKEGKSTFNGNKRKVEYTMVTYVWVQKPIEYDPEDKPKKGENRPEFEWEKVDPVEWVRREREAGRIPPRARTEAETTAIDEAITEAESVQWNI